jgi:hypothetical protein
MTDMLIWTLFRLKKKLRAADASVRLSAIKALPKQHDARIVRVLITALRDHDASVSSAAKASLEELWSGPWGYKVVQVLKSLLASTILEEQQVLKKILYDIASDQLSVLSLPNLILVPGTSDSRKSRAADILGELGDVRAIPYLEKMLHNDGNLATRYDSMIAASALKKIRGGGVAAAKSQPESICCPNCQTVYNRKEVVQQILKHSPELSDFSVATTNFRCIKCSTVITITLSKQETTPVVNEEEIDKTTEKEQINTEASRVNEPSKDSRKSHLVFTLNSISIEQSYQYASNSTQKKITASSDYRFLIAKCTIRNSTNYLIRFSSEQFSILNNSGKKIDAFLYGVGNSVAESGKVISFDTKINGPDGIQIVSFKGKVSPDVSFIEWELSPNRSYEDTIVYLVPVNELDLTLQFFSSDNSAKHLQESQISITFNSLNVQQSHQFKSGTSQKEITASSDDKFLIAKITMLNNADCAMKFSSEQFTIFNNINSKINASFYGVDDNIVEYGKIISFESKENEAGEILKVSIRGKLSPSVSFVEWGLAPHKSYQGNLVYLIPSSEHNVKMKFSYNLGNGKVYEKVSENGSVKNFV